MNAMPLTGSSFAPFADIDLDAARDTYSAWLATAPSQRSIPADVRSAILSEARISFADTIVYAALRSCLVRQSRSGEHS